ncbi:MAG: hypothetical protein JSW50_06800 [Candidatus Latescibacterota bacterium]|nr:MAG: hypothetical protein JSW50_06800 [Candidatus Latescibacterota bacterium]
MTNDELTPQEKKALESLPKERVPSAFLEERVVRRLRKRGVLQSSGSRWIQVTGFRIGAVVAACLAFVICGFALGFWANAQRGGYADLAVTGENGAPVALSVQQAGTAYILALENLARQSGTAPAGQVEQGREVALATLYTAADQMAQIIPRDLLSKCIVNAIETTEGSGQDGLTDEDGERVIQF